MLEKQKFLSGIWTFGLSTIVGLASNIIAWSWSMRSFVFAYQVGMGIGFFFQNFHTSLVLLMGPRLIFGWYKLVPRTVRVFATSLDSVRGQLTGQINTRTRRRPTYQTNTPLECRTSEANDQYRVCWSSFVQCKSTSNMLKVP